jgi:hypothetical protein
MLNVGFTYAGTQYSVECFCGNSQPDVAHALQDSKCNMPCPGLRMSSNIVVVFADVLSAELNFSYFQGTK